MRCVAPVLAALTAFGGHAPVWADEAASRQRLCNRCVVMNAKNAVSPPQLFALKCRVERSETQVDVTVVLNGRDPVCRCSGALAKDAPMDGETPLAWRRLTAADATGAAAPITGPGAPPTRWLTPTQPQLPKFRGFQPRGDHYPDPATRPPETQPPVPETHG